MALLEGTDRTGEDRMLRVLDLNQISQVAGECFTDSRTAKKVWPWP